MATRKQRRRREKEQRHDYEIVYVDNEGNEVEPDETEVGGPAKRNGAVKAKPTKGSSGSRRRGRAPQAPSWKRVAKRGAIFAPLFLATVLLLGGKSMTLQGAVAQTLILLVFFVPFSYLLDTLLWRSYQKKLGPSGREALTGARRTRSRPRDSVGPSPRRLLDSVPMPPVVEQLPLGPIETNCYLVRAELGAPEAVVVDPSGDPATIRLRLAQMASRCIAILLTHGHWDHLLGVAELAEGTGAPVYMAAGERILLEQPDAFSPVPVRAYVPDVLLGGDELLELAAVTFQVVAVPGHSPAHLAYVTDGCVFSGDVLFAGSVGRTDLPGASWETLLDSIRSLAETCPPETIVYPGHGPMTTLGAELDRNPFLTELRAEQRS